MERYKVIVEDRNNGKMLFGLPIIFIYCFIAIIVIILALIFGIIFLVLHRRNTSKKRNNQEKQLKVIDSSNGHTFVVTTSGAVINTKNLKSSLKANTISTIDSRTNSQQSKNTYTDSTDDTSVPSTSRSPSHISNFGCDKPIIVAKYKNNQTQDYQHTGHHALHQGVQLGSHSNVRHGPT